jgi:excinuclease UvrABC helicase subunit UvrB
MKDFNDKNDDELEDFFNSMFNNMFKKGILRESSFDLNNIEDNLGEPTSVRQFKENGFTFEERIWETENGSYRTYTTISNPMNERTKPLFKNKDLPLEEQLKIALEEERYERAAEIRDEIKTLKTK